MLSKHLRVVLFSFGLFHPKKKTRMSGSHVHICLVLPVDT